MKVVKDMKELRKQVESSTKEDPIAEYSKALLEAMPELKAQSLAANQIGINARMFVMKREANSPVCIVNPLISKSRGNMKSNETCISLPGVTIRVARPVRITVVGYDQYWNLVRHRFTGIDARRACHEIDHLNGKLISDRTQKAGDGNVVKESSPAPADEVLEHREPLPEAEKAKEPEEKESVADRIARLRKGLNG